MYSYTTEEVAVKFLETGTPAKATDVPGYRCSSPSERDKGGKGAESGSVGLNRGRNGEWTPTERCVSREKPGDWHLNSLKNRVKSGCD